MLRKILPVFLLLSLPSLSLAGITVENKHRIPNAPNGVCAWASLETLARHHGIKNLYGIRDHYANWRDSNNQKWRGGADADDLVQQCMLLQVPVKGFKHGPWNLMQKACDQNLGCVIGIQDWPSEGDKHALTLIDWKDDWIWFLDCNDTGHVYKAEVKWLEQHWMGFVVVIWPESHAGVKTFVVMVLVDRQAMVAIHRRD